MRLTSICLCTFYLVFSLSVDVVFGDVYLHNPRGSNDRLNEQQRDRANERRLFDSQDNDRGGYLVGSANFQTMEMYQPNNPNAYAAQNGVNNENDRAGQDMLSTTTPPHMYYYEGSVMNIEFTAQHGCANPVVSCTIIIQYMCNPLIRDGRTTARIPLTAAATAEANRVAAGGAPNGQFATCDQNNCDTDFMYGRHESEASYVRCKSTTRNQGLFTSDRALNGYSATYTLQDEDGGDPANRHGYECVEERDYYPYWGASEWKDIAILTDNPDRCAAYQANSQNAIDKNICIGLNPSVTSQCDSGNGNGNSNCIPIDPVTCRARGGIWSAVPAWNIPPPDCVANIYKSRDNHLGNVGVTGQPYNYNWTIPSDYSESCVLRLRYNITTGEYANQGFNSPTGINTALDSTFNSAQPGNTQYATNVPIWETYGLSEADVAGEYPVPNANENSRGYVFKGNGNNPPNTAQRPAVDIFGDLLLNTPTVSSFSSPDAYKALYKGHYRQGLIALSLAINTNQYGRTFQDRSHTFSIRQRPAALDGVTIHNLNVRGKRGNIVQVYPSTEYDFVPNQLMAQVGEMIHFQWIGSDNNPRNNDPTLNIAAIGQALGTDRSNLVVLAPPNPKFPEVGQNLNPAFHNTSGQLGRIYPCYNILDPVQCPFLALDPRSTLNLALNGINTSYFDLGPRQVRAPGVYHYISTRNNAFSNRQQKGTIVVAPNSNWNLVDWGANSEAELDSGRAWIDESDDGAQLFSGDVYVQAVGSSGYDSAWIQVMPQVIQIPCYAPHMVPDPTGQTNLVPSGWCDSYPTLTLNIPYPYKPLNNPQVYYKPNATVTDLALVSNVQFSNGMAQVLITPNTPNNGGYYVVQQSINVGAIAGIVVGCIGLISVFAYVYWKVRMQPIGGVGKWLKAQRKIAKENSVDGRSSVNQLGPLLPPVNNNPIRNSTTSSMTVV